MILVCGLIKNILAICTLTCKFRLYKSPKQFLYKCTITIDYLFGITTSNCFHVLMWAVISVQAARVQMAAQVCGWPPKCVDGRPNMPMIAQVCG